MPDGLAGVVVERREFVRLIRRVRDPGHVRPRAIVLNAGTAVGIERGGNRSVIAVPAVGGEKPQAGLQHRPPPGALDGVNFFKPVDSGQTQTDTAPREDWILSTALPL